LEETGGDRAAVLSHLRRAVTDEREHEEGRPRAAAEDAVHVTTIHKAKGLDFDHVYLLQLHKGGGQDDPRETRVAAGSSGAAEYRLCGVASLAFHEVARRRAEIERHERVRLFYVALTRARQRLVLAGSHPRTASPARKTLADLWALRDPAPPDLEALMTELAPSGRCALREGDLLWSFPALAADEPSPAAELAARAAPDAARVLRDDAELARLGARARERAARVFHAVASQDRDDTESALARGYGEEEEPADRAPRRRDDDRARRLALAVGTAVHAGLERLDVSLEIAGQRLRFAAEVEAALALAVGPEDRAAARARALEIFERFRAGPLYQRVRALGPRLLARELPVLLAPAGQAGPVGFWSGSIDLLYWDTAAGEYVVVDYKTDRVAPAEAREVAERYRPQGKVYTRAVQAALGLSAPPRFELWFLSPGEVVALSGEEPAAG
jgi:ATP-dependent helicase/nuclease subunit A